jgi:hypothetical protein
MAYEGVLKTVLQKGKPESTLNKRAKRIQEAIGWKSGTKEKPRKYLIATLPNNKEVYFLKPGKEAFNIKRPNPHDMTPVVGDPEERPKFDEIWSYISSISVKNFEIFKAVLTLIYRSAYMLDHAEVKKGIVRYQPSKEICELVEDMENSIGAVSPLGLMGLLHFLDILGWNEDVKYHAENSRVVFDGEHTFKTGRINTLLTCIRVPYQASTFLKSVIENPNKTDINFKNLYTIMQQFAKSRGTCVPTQEQLLEWLSPYLIET